MSIEGTLEVVKDAEALAARAADLVAGHLKDCEAPFRLVLSGGTTPVAAYHAAGAAQRSAVALRRDFLQRRALRAAGPSRQQLPHGPRDAAGRRHAPRAARFAILTDDTPRGAAAAL